MTKFYTAAGEFSVEKLLDALIGGEDNGVIFFFKYSIFFSFLFSLCWFLILVMLQACPDQFQFVKNLVDELGYEV